MNIAARITHFYTQQNLTRNQLAIRSGVSYDTIRKILDDNNRDPQIGTIERICDGLGITLAEFFDDDVPVSELPPNVWQAMQTISEYVKKNSPGQ